jgi:hypothetical protein
MFDSLEKYLPEVQNQAPLPIDPNLKVNYIRFKELLLKLGMISEVTGGPSES